MNDLHYFSTIFIQIGKVWIDLILPLIKHIKDRYLSKQFHCNDIFADTSNELLFAGEQFVRPEDLVDASPCSQYKVDNDEIHEQIRDGSKYWKKNDIIIFLMAIENQLL